MEGKAKGSEKHPEKNLRACPRCKSVALEGATYDCPRCGLRSPWAARPRPVRRTEAADDISTR